MTDITKSAPLPERPCEQLTCCAVCTCEIKHEHDSRYQAGGQGYQPGGRFLPDLRRRGHFAKKSSMANLSGLEDKKGFVFSTLDNSASSRSMVFSCLCRMISSSCVCVSCFGDSVLLVMVLPCKAMRRSTSHHGADSFYPLGSMPRRFSSALANSLNQLPSVRPSEVAASLTCWRSSLLILIWKVGDHPSPRGDLSRFNVDMYVHNSYYHRCCVRTITVGTAKNNARTVWSSNGRLTNNVN
ncbi:hypothetical protein F0Q28_001411 [Escherichia coli]|nr:hypothetical protein [Escherichia coli]